ncbi:hypothetical protein H6P81_015723 [Aristolochia fimbriata]|uniref:Uncharacterized protein n=1 Tax=Aristolochia fimbriata TaxID=158543 RepID=A0AAV7E6C5_ARIFI|nr:hypothetical protein H6P81_015723 [Aristolochia fimbriata]
MPFHNIYQFYNKEVGLNSVNHYNFGLIRSGGTLLNNLILLNYDRTFMALGGTNFKRLKSLLKLFPALK